MIGQRKGGFLVPALLVTACGTLAWLVGSQIMQMMSPEAPVVTTPRKPIAVKSLDSISAELKFSMPPISRYDSILDRPIFSSSRRGGTTEVITPKVVVTRELKLKLTGTTIADNVKYALLLPKEGGEALTMREGEDYQGWTLARVRVNTVIFRRNGAEERLTIDYVEPPTQVPNKRRGRRAQDLRAEQQQQLLQQRANNQNLQRRQDQLQNRNYQNGNPDEDGDGQPDIDELD